MPGATRSGGRRGGTSMEESERNDVIESYRAAHKSVRQVQDDDVAEYITLKLQEIASDVESIAAENGFQLWVADYIDEAAADPDRDTPLCHCDDPQCDLKQGRLPSRVEMADELREGVHRYRQNHPRPTVLIEAQQAYHEMRSKVRNTANQMQAVAQKGELRDYQEEELRELRDR